MDAIRFPLDMTFFQVEEIMDKVTRRLKTFQHPHHGQKYDKTYFATLQSSARLNYFRCQKHDVVDLRSLSSSNSSRHQYPQFPESQRSEKSGITPMTLFPNHSLHFIRLERTIGRLFSRNRHPADPQSSFSHALFIPILPLHCITLHVRRSSPYHSATFEAPSLDVA